MARPVNGENMATNAELEELFFSQVPDSFLRRALGAVFLAHRVSLEECRARFAATEAANLRGFYRRAAMEGYLRDAADLSAELATRVVQGEKGSWFHTEVLGGQTIVTAHTVPHAGALVRKADFRIALAQTNEPTLFDRVIEEEELPPLYAMLIHSRSRWETREEREKFSHLPGSTYLAFPAHSLDYYIHKVNLFDRYPDIVAAHEPDDLDGIAKMRYVQRSRAAYFAK
jgi:hypothetical protein